jgi:hypothetical protein
MDRGGVRRQHEAEQGLAAAHADFGFKQGLQAADLQS